MAHRRAEFFKYLHTGMHRVVLILTRTVETPSWGHLDHEPLDGCPRVSKRNRTNRLCMYRETDIKGIGSCNYGVP